MLGFGIRLFKMVKIIIFYKIKLLWTWRNSFLNYKIIIMMMITIIYHIPEVVKKRHILYIIELRF